MDARGDWRDGLPDSASVAGGADRAALPAVRAVRLDSREVEAGDLFVCVPGQYVDGHDFAAAAVAAGAAAVVAELGRGEALRALDVPVVEVPSGRRALSAIAAAHEGYPSERLTVVGVTGTNGKTTTTLLVHAALEAAGEEAGLLNTVETRIGAVASTNDTRMSTQEAPVVQRLLAEMVEAGCAYAIVEATSHGLELDRLTDVAFDVGVLTNLGTDHLDFHGTAEAYANAKRRLFTQLEFKSWLKELDGGAAAAVPAAAPTATPASAQAFDRDAYETVLDPAALERWCERLAAADSFAFDLETDSLDPITARIVGVSFACEPGQAAYVPLGHDYPGAPDQLPADAVLTRLKPLLEADAPCTIGQGFKFDYTVLAQHGIAVAGPAFDTMLESYVLDSTASRHDMDTLALKHLGHTTITFKDVAGSGKSQITFNQVDLATATRYAAEDADVTLRLHRQFWPRIEAEPTLRRVFETIEMPLLPVLSRIERHGVLIDAALLRRQSGELAESMQRLEAQAHELAGRPFNLGSPLQIQQILYDEQKLPVLGRTPKGQPSTAEDVLQELALHYPLPRVILEHRGLSKLRSTYTDKLPAQVNPATGRVHTSYQQAVASTGRLSSSDPNLQNIPVRTAEGRRIRQAFIAPEGCKLLSADYSQIELRIMAHLSGDEGLCRAFAEGADVHRATAGEIFGVGADGVTAEQRRAAKAINFGLIYGMSAFGLAQQLNIDRGAAQRYVDQYFERYPGVRAYMDATREQARERGYVETVFGRRLYLPDIRAGNAQRRQYAERTAINAPMQGTAADLIKLAMIRIDRWLRDSGEPARMILQVHDELVFEVTADTAEAVRAEVTALMTADNPLGVPLLVETGLGANWDQAH